MIVRLMAFPLMMVLLVSSFAFSQNQRNPTEGYRAQLVVPARSGWESKDVMLTFDRDHIILRLAKDDLMSETIRYSDISRVEYSHTKNHRKIGGGAAVAANISAPPLLMRQGENYWLTIDSEGHETYLSLEKDNYQAVVSTFQTMVGNKLEGWDAPAVASRR